MWLRNVINTEIGDRPVTDMLAVRWQWFMQSSMQFGSNSNQYFLANKVSAWISTWHLNDAFLERMQHAGTLLARKFYVHMILLSPTSRHLCSNNYKTWPNIHLITNSKVGKHLLHHALESSHGQRDGPFNGKSIVFKFLFLSDSVSHTV